MASDPFYPFGLPGINPLGSTGQANPLTASLEMMRNAMSSFGQSASLASGTMAQSLNPEDLEKRIAELKVVENWLKLNLSMLSSSIQGMEVQLATIKTLRSFVEMGSQGASDDGQQPSPLEIVLGIRKPSAQTSANPGRSHVQPQPAPPASASAPEPESPEPPAQAPRADGQPEPDADKASASHARGAASDASAMPETSQAAAQAWWDMLQNQFGQIAAATTQAAQFAKPTDVTSEEKPAAKPRAARKSSTRSAAKSAGAGSGSASRPSARKATRPVKTPKN